MMRLQVVSPTAVEFDALAIRVRAEGAEGQFTLLPQHQSYVALLVAGVMEVRDDAQQVHYLAIDEGVLVKQQEAVFVSTRHALVGKDLSALHKLIEESYLKLDEQERKGRTDIAKLEASFVRRFLDQERA